MTSPSVAAAAGPAGGTSPGRALAAARTARGLTVEQVAESLRYAPRQIAALEYDDYAALPGPTTVRGMVRAYARLVSLDPQTLLDSLKPLLAAPPSVAVHEMSVPFPRRSDRGHRLYLVWSIVLLVIAGAVLAEWKFGGDAAFDWVRRLTVGSGGAGSASPPARETARSPSQEAVAVSPQPVVGAPEPAAPALTTASTEPPVESVRPPIPAGHRRIVLHFERESWTQVRSGTGELLVNGFHKGGTEQVVSGPPPIQFVIGAAGGVRLTYQDEPVDIAQYTKVDVARFTLE